MFVLGIDPGLATTGYAVVGESRHGLRAAAVGVIRTDPARPLAGRLAELHRDLTQVIAEHRPEAVAIEEVFVNRNLATASSVARASGVAVLCAGLAGLPVFEYSPSGVKKAVGGFGGASKQQVRRMLLLRMGLDSLPGPADATDALAVALCHLQSGALLRALEASA
jgi:crossover junction endodeoxyribonuclease RuvC